MTNLSAAFQPAIDALEKDLAELERQRNALMGAINILRAKASLPPRPNGGGRGESTPLSGNETTGSGPVLAQIKPDTFFGKRMGTAAREFLEMRKAQGSGPAKPREIYEALVAGGFVFEAKDPNVSMVSLRATLRKNTAMFQKLPSGTYGLRSWYPNSKPPKEAPGSKDQVSDSLTGDAAESDDSENTNLGGKAAA